MVGLAATARRTLVRYTLRLDRQNRFVELLGRPLYWLPSREKISGDEATEVSLRAWKDQWILWVMRKDGKPCELERGRSTVSLREIGRDVAANLGVPFPEDKTAKN